MELELLKILQKRYNFRTYFIDGHQEWGVQVNGTWTGVVGQVLYEVIYCFYLYTKNIVKFYYKHFLSRNHKWQCVQFLKQKKEKL